MLLCQSALDHHELHAHDTQTTLLKTPDYLAGQATLDSIRLDDD
jgi:hypothetical protein